MAIIDSIKNKLGAIIYPKTLTKAVYEETTNKRLDNILGVLSSLDTTVQTDLVSSINEVNTNQTAHLAETTTSATQPHGLAKNKLDATVAPTVNEDSGDGYGINSVWVDVTADKAYVCLDATAGGAVWKEITGGATVPSCRVYHNASQSISNAEFIVLAFNSERWDNDSIHDTTTNNSRLTCKTAGKYLIVANVQFAGNATGVRYITIKHNGSTHISGSQSPSADSALKTIIETSTIWDLAANDYVEAVVFQNSGGALNVDVAANYSPEFMMVKVG